MKTLGTNNFNKTALWHRTELTKRYLNQARIELQQYSAVVIGTGNANNGQKNIIFGNKNNINGN